ncbi:hypothetical protein [Anaeromicropila populeti]|uniref:Stage III sporulation protein AG n=1 Tax=Anaeromicropila populeti TaxID=37658 RepID=A0A1I6ILE2_9FIRM|nr:hypothetical protein [Anaeromicropila populeti]SFR67555.1 stage III sporulation protein AG [Anaeromicropila populeti]
MEEKKEKGGKLPLKLSIKEIGLSKICIMALAGIVLLICFIPDIGGADKSVSQQNGQEVSAEIKTNAGSTGEYLEEMENKLEGILNKVDGIGKVEVMITAKASKEQVTLKDSPVSQDNTTETDGSGGSRVSSSIDREEETILIQSGQGETSPYIVKELEPEIEGVLVIAQGGDNSSIISEINSAVQVLFDVPAHKIKVMKMN